MAKHKVVELVAKANRLAGPNRIAALEAIERLVGAKEYRWAVSRYESAMWFAAEESRRPSREEFGGAGQLLGMA